MEMFDSPADRAFRSEVRSFFEVSVPDHIRQRTMTGLPLDRPMLEEWHKIVLACGWAAPSWPAEHGGTGWSLRQQYIFEQERNHAFAPLGVTFNFDMVGPLLIKYGSEDQKRRLLPRALSAEDFWCQGFSEPGAGSDLAALSCRATRKGDRYIINGSKLWQTVAFDADMMFGLFRTSQEQRKQQGITLLLVDMRAKGLSLSPVPLIDGVERVAACTFDDVEVPVENLVGEDGYGWSIAKYLLTIERLGIAEVAASKAALARLKRLAARETSGGIPLIQDPYLLAELAVLEAELNALEATEYRFLFNPLSNGELGAEASILKIAGTLIRQRLTELTMRVAGPAANDRGSLILEGTLDDSGTYPAWATRHYLNFRKISIYGGSNEIQKNIVAKAVLGL
ncbi:MAG: acyl-CoA dehydrogenase family protein [Hyphomicrobiales bacterium]